MGEAKRKTAYFRDMPGAREAADPVRAAAIHMLYERAKRNVLAKAKADGVEVPDETQVVMDVAPPEKHVQIAMADVRNVLAFLGFQLAAEGAEKVN